MLAPLRRCPASLPRALSATTRFALRSTSIASPRAGLPSRIAPLLSVRAFQSTVRQAGAQAAAATTATADISASPITKFEELQERGIVHKNVIKAIVDDMGIHTMTDVQSATINQALQGTDLIAQAKTGTGKTLGFLLPMLQNILSKDPKLAEPDRTSSFETSFGRGNSFGRGRFQRQTSRRPHLVPDIRAIIISPTRELAEQIAVEARKLTRHTSVKVQTAVGGTGKREGLRRIMTEGCHVLVATPGRLNDILSDEFNPIPVQNLDYFIYDEADRLMETGFMEEIKEIQKSLPPTSLRDRQTLMFSATVPKEVVKLVRQTLKPGFHFVKTVRDDEEPTHQRIPQKVVFTNGFETQLPALLELCQREAILSQKGEKRPFKAIVYFNSLKETQISYSAFNRIRRAQRSKHALWDGDLLFIHSDLQQSARQRQADSFRAAERAILFSTDVTARGMDFPNVTHVIQMGLPRDPPDYVHRIGRTGRAGKEGEGWVIMPEMNAYQIRQKLPDLPIKPDNSLATATADLEALDEVPEHASNIIQALQDSFSKVDEMELEEAFPRILSAASNTKDKHALVESLKSMAKNLWGLQQEPYIPPNVLRGIGLDRPNRSRNQGSRGRGFDRNSRDGRGGFDRNSRGGRGGFDMRPRDNAPFGGRGGFDRKPRDDAPFGGRGGFDRKPRGDAPFGQRQDSRDHRGGKPPQSRWETRGRVNRAF
ncbi:ATP-dependent RNA helicase [Lasiodiplodia theobromae]|uniref:ATP-dependent RNA helicase n=1 Tax=Lasiodiplodia theobromae TaxID=45133 RepID=A0A5N5DM01_9PEZI|nr:ATP-dependent RNA helicase [Lasiodiplodia theobromae]